ncbi:unnamed protein product [Phytomonas sp. EM1]|nr:unnamed protein product [Phytomonas sp. EM1]|eukprot:CCW63506.1 unnamed protein product [Phytomonas sp. isolate EM1]
MFVSKLLEECRFLLNTCGMEGQAEGKLDRVIVCQTPLDNFRG